MVGASQTDAPVPVLGLASHPARTGGHQWNGVAGWPGPDTLVRFRGPATPGHAAQATRTHIRTMRNSNVLS